jgi:hypothetical protein
MSTELSVVRGQPVHGPIDRAAPDPSGSAISCRSSKKEPCCGVNLRPTFVGYLFFIPTNCLRFFSAIPFPGETAVAHVRAHCAAPMPSLGDSM